MEFLLRVHKPKTATDDALNEFSKERIVLGKLAEKAIDDQLRTRISAKLHLSNASTAAFSEMISAAEFTEPAHTASDKFLRYIVVVEPYKTWVPKAGKLLLAHQNKVLQKEESEQLYALAKFARRVLKSTIVQTSSCLLTTYFL